MEKSHPIIQMISAIKIFPNLLTQFKFVNTPDGGLNSNGRWIAYQVTAYAHTIKSIVKSIFFIFQSARLYCTKFMQVLLRGKVAGFSSWGVELLVNQLYDQSVQVAHSALHVLEEACDVEVGIYHECL